MGGGGPFAVMDVLLGCSFSVTLLENKYHVKSRLDQEAGSMGGKQYLTTH